MCTPGTAWNVTEACLFVMQAIAGYIPLLVTLLFFYMIDFDFSSLSLFAVLGRSLKFFP